jgi:hypothetical protein
LGHKAMDFSKCSLVRMGNPLRSNCRFYLPAHWPMDRHELTNRSSTTTLRHHPQLAFVASIRLPDLQCKVMSMLTPSRRRWFQFSLRTMFMAVTVFALWLGWELRIVRQRLAMLREITEARGGVILADDHNLIFVLNGVAYDNPTLPF